MKQPQGITPISMATGLAALGPLIGAHMSIAGGMSRAIDRALAVRARVLQVFTRNTNQWKARRLLRADIRSFREAWRQSGLHSVVAHDCYLINLASPKAALRRRSIEALAEELSRCEALDIPYLVTHPGAHMGAGLLEGCDRVADSLNRARGIAPATSVTVLLETVAGQGTTIGRRFEDLARIRGGVERPNLVEFCLDTCHVHAAGYDIVSERGYEQTIQEFDEILGLEALRAIHFNDSKTERGSLVDRHEHIGKGHLGASTFARMLRDPRLGAIPKLLETPKGKDGVVMDRRNLALLRRLWVGKSPSED
jgi:deoxyribonuclease-4